MITVMVVEDEPPILRDIKNLIEATDPEFKVISCACNGHDAINVLESTVPDIVFTDIQMPVVDGLMLLDHLHRRFPGIIPVVLSGYSDFNYARKAMAFGVNNYLLKPVDEDELSRLLADLSKKVRQKRYDLVSKYFSSPAENASGTASGEISFDNSIYLAVLFCAGPLSAYSYDNYSSALDFWKNNSIEEAIAQLLDKEENIWVFDGKTGSEKIALLTLKKCSIERADRLSSALFERLGSSMLPITMVVSPFMEKFEEIGRQLQNIRMTLVRESVFGFSQLIKLFQPVEASNTATNEGFEVDHSLEDRLSLYIRQGNLPLLKTDLKKQFKHWENHRITQLQLETRVRNIISCCYRSLPMTPLHDDTTHDYEIREAISVSRNYQELFENLWYIFEELIDIRSEKSPYKESTSILMNKIDKFIRANLVNYINTRTLSEQFGLVPSYLSKLFKDYKGISPSDYLLKLRIEKAKELISSQPDFLTKDIAESIGFSDPLYFSKIFKKHTGMTPSEYKSTAKGSSRSIESPKKV